MSKSGGEGGIKCPFVIQCLLFGTGRSKHLLILTTEAIEATGEAIVSVVNKTPKNTLRL